MPRRSFDIPNVKHNAPIPMASVIGNVMYTSGIMGGDPNTGQMPATLDEQAANCFKNLQTVLDTAGFKTSDVLKVTVYIKSQQNRQLVNPPWLAMFPDEHNRPARHQTVVETLNFDIQIEAFCVKE